MKQMESYQGYLQDENSEEEVQQPKFRENNENMDSNLISKTSIQKDISASEKKQDNPGLIDLSQQYDLNSFAGPIMQKAISQNDQENSNGDYEQNSFENYDSNSQDNIKSEIINSEQFQSEQLSQNKKKGQQNKKMKNKRSASKDPKVLQTMKAYFPTLNQQKVKQTVLPQQSANMSKIYGQARSNTTGSQNNNPKGYQVQHSERIIFVENRRKDQQQMQQVPLERRNSQINSSATSLTNQSQVQQKQEVLDQQKQSYNPPSPGRNKVLSPLSNNNNLQQVDIQKQWSDKKNPSSKMLSTVNVEQNVVFFEDGEAQENERLNQQQKDYHKKNYDMLKQMQEKKMMELKMIEEERRKMQRKQEKLKQMILKQAAEVREKRQKDEQEMKQKMSEEQKGQKKTPKKVKPFQVPPSLYQPPPKIEQNEQQPEQNENNEEAKKQKEIMKKYFRNRYHSFLQTLIEQNKKRELDLEEVKKQEERRKAKLKENLGIANVQSKLFNENQPSEKIVEEIPQLPPTKEKPKRGSSVSAIKSNTVSQKFNKTTSNDDDSVLAIQKIYQPQSRERSSSKSLKRALTPKVKKSKRIVVMPIEEKNEEDFEKEQKAKREAAEKIKIRQQKYLQELQQKKEKDQLLAEEERKKKEKLKEMARQQAKQNFEKVQNQPGLKELQEKQDKLKSSEDDEDEDEDEETKEKKKKKKDKKKTPQEAHVEAFLERNNPKRVIFPNITDLATWKRKYKVDDNVKVFICTGGYPDIKKALKKRGWVQNKDPTSPCFDFKWVLKSKDIDHNTLNDSQLVNHFNKAAAITTKVGLCHNLKNLIWFNNVDIDTFYPRCFDLALQEELEDFIQEFKAVKAESYVKIFVNEMRESKGEKYSVPDKVLKVAMKVCDRKLMELDDLIDDPNSFADLVSDEEWKILGADELTTESLAKKKHEDWLNKNEVMQAERKKQEKQDKAKEEKKKKKKKKVKKVSEKKAENDDGENYEDDQFEQNGIEGWNSEKKNDDVEGEEDDVVDDENDEEAKQNKVQQDTDNMICAKSNDFKRAIKILEEMKKKYPQFNVNGHQNIWIVKPAGSSRGRGIVLYKSLVEILDLCKQKEAQYIAQKYIENPLIVKCRKFDIRQWVLVTDWNPLTVWVYEEPYFRFPASDYDATNITDRFIHLTNNSVAKYAETATITHEIEGNMWCLEEMKNYLQEEFGWDVWEDKLKEQSNNIIINCLESVQDMFECKKGCFELFGFDLMIDDDFNMWLIEVNSSPAMDYSTKVTERLVKLVLEDVVKVVVDYEQAKKKSKVDTGLWKKIYQAKRIVDKPINSFGLNLICEGKKIANNKLNLY